MKDKIKSKLDEIRADHSDSVPIGEITAVVESILTSMSGDISSSDFKLYHELEVLALYIDNAKIEIASLRPDEIPQEHIPSATDELDAIVEHTEEATGTILDAAEKLEELAASSDKKTAETITEAVTSIYEACNFQDITGQRITKIVKTLKHIEEKVDALIAAFGEQVNDSPEERNKVAGKKKNEELNEDENLKHGPQLKKNAQSQKEIDALLAGSD
ncbi:MAG: protein phosphatase CheZ [Proteobacteria bacterium]|nr:protein phosphatase CheZ [Pseudomonadota bacterium]